MFVAPLNHNGNNTTSESLATYNNYWVTLIFRYVPQKVKRGKGERNITLAEGWLGLLSPLSLRLSNLSPYKYDDKVLHGTTDSKINGTLSVRYREEYLPVRTGTWSNTTTCPNNRPMEQNLEWKLLPRSTIEIDDDVQNSKKIERLFIVHCSLFLVLLACRSTLNLRLIATYWS